MNDLKFALRQLLKNRGFTAVAVLTLALGTGANTAIFSVFNGVLLKPLPYPEPDRLVTLFERNPQRGIERQPVSPANFAEWQRQNQVFEGLGFWRGDEPVNLVTTEGAEKIQGSFVSSAMFILLGAKPLLGRLTLPEEDRLRGPIAAVLSYEVWQHRFGADPNVLGKLLTIDRHGSANYPIVGVLPPGFHFPGQTELWLSWSGLSVNRIGATRLSVIARLKPGVTSERARAEMSALQTRLPQSSREAGGSEVAVVPLLEQLVGRNMKLALLVLWAVVAGVLLIACVNVANLLLARAADRQKEIVLRFALGASRWRVLRQLLTESVLLALMGGALGVLLGKWGLQLFLAAGPANVARLQEVTLDGTALFFTVLISIATGILFGLAPAWEFTRTDLNERLKEDNRGASGGRYSMRIRNSLVVGEVALALVLLIGAGLMLQSFVHLMRTDRGIKPEHVLTASLDFSVSEFTDSRTQVRLQELLQRLRNQPGVQAVGATSSLPRRNSGPPKEPIVILGRASGVVDDSPTADHSGATPDYFRTMGIPLLRGRYFTEADRLESQPILIINDALAKRYFGNEDPVGKRLAFPSRTNRWAPAEYYTNGLPEIVGVVADVSTLTQNPEVHPHFYSPYWQYPMPNPVVAVRVTGNPAAFAPIIQREIKAVAPLLPAPAIQTMNNILAQTVAHPRFQAWMLSVFGTIALVLAAVGLYGVLAYAVTQRQREIGVRMALGAQQRDVLRLIVGQGMRLALIGVVLGLIGAFALTRVLQSLLYEVKATDPLTFGGVSLLLVTIALLACWVPARRATQVDPMETLRHE